VVQKAVIWDDLSAQSDSEKLDAALKMAQINSASIATGSSHLHGEEIRTVAGYEGSLSHFQR
jgi:hypothetical protein